MSIAGILPTRPRDLDALIRAMARPLTHGEAARREFWATEDAALCRIHAGRVNSEPQPLSTPDGALRIVMSGECFDYETDRRTLERQGYTFRQAANDAEDCLNVYAARGIAGLRRLNGSFACAILDTRSRELVLVSDRFASRPLFYAFAPDGSLVFGSQVSAILQVPDIPRDLEMNGVYSLIATQAVPGTLTLHRAVRMLPPASAFRFRDGKVSHATYWQGNYQPEPRTLDAWAEDLASAIRTSVRRVTRGPHRFGLLLSGGMDSRMVLAAAEKELT